MTFNDIITSILNLFGIYSAPVTVQEFLWDAIIIFVGLFVIKSILAFVFGFFKEINKF